MRHESAGRGLMLTYCPKCMSFVSESETDINALNDWAYKEGHDRQGNRRRVSFNWNGRECPNKCFG